MWIILALIIGMLGGLDELAHLNIWKKNWHLMFVIDDNNKLLLITVTW